MQLLHVLSSGSRNSAHDLLVFALDTPNLQRFASGMIQKVALSINLVDLSFGISKFHSKLTKFSQKWSKSLEYPQNFHILFSIALNIIKLDVAGCDSITNNVVWMKMHSGMTEFRQKLAESRRIPRSSKTLQSFAFASC